MTARFAGTVVCLASGPSLTETDIEAIRQTGYPTIATNNTWEKARFCTIVYGGDANWWSHNASKVDIPAERWTCSKNAVQKYGLKFRKPMTNGGYNSGANAIELAVHLGAERVLLLGYDCSVKHGLHHHGKHTKTQNPNPHKCEMWKRQYQQLAKLKADIINCSRYTELKCFRRMELEEGLK